MLTTVSEMTRLLLAFQNGVELYGTRILSNGTIATMVEDHTPVCWNSRKRIDTDSVES